MLQATETATHSDSVLITSDEIDRLEPEYIDVAREDFWAFRCYVRPQLIQGVDAPVPRTGSREK